MLENQNLNDPSKDPLRNKNENHPVIDESREPVLDEHAYKEETAAEITDTRPVPAREEQTDDHDDSEVTNMYGWIAIALSAISFFWIPLLFAGAGIILGIFARNREAPILGNTAIVIGVLSIVTRLFILPLI